MIASLPSLDEKMLCREEAMEALSTDPPGSPMWQSVAEEIACDMLQSEPYYKLKDLAKMNGGPKVHELACKGPCALSTYG